MFFEKDIPHRINILYKMILLGKSDFVSQSHLAKEINEDITNPIFRRILELMEKKQIIIKKETFRNDIPFLINLNKLYKFVLSLNIMKQTLSIFVLIPEKIKDAELTMILKNTSGWKKFKE